MTRLRARVAKAEAGTGCGPAEWHRGWAGFERAALEGLAFTVDGPAYREDVRDVVRNFRQAYRPGMDGEGITRRMEAALEDLSGRLSAPVFRAVLAHMAWGAE